MKAKSSKQCSPALCINGNELLYYQKIIFGKNGLSITSH